MDRAQIRGDVYGYVYAGDPWSATSLAFQDAALSHTFGYDNSKISDLVERTYALALHGLD